MKLKPAGIKTIREAIERLMNGEVFYSTEGCKIIYDDVNTSCGLRLYSPFKIISGTDICEPVNYLWEQALHCLSWYRLQHSNQQVLHTH